MTLPLTPNIAKAVARLYPQADVKEVVRLLTEQCADSLPNCQDSDEYGLEDLRFAVLKLSGGNLAKLREVVRMANEDWRDVIWEAGSVRHYQRELLDHSFEPNVKSQAAWHARGWNKLGIIAGFTSSFILGLSGASSEQWVGIVILVAVIHAAGLRLIQRPLGVPHEGAAMLFKMELIIIGGTGGLGYLAARVIQPLL
ncbi:hypothetical protein [Accumulibacter sp.]|uniref:hypothetical protein n=1 Tax=Accumulibacter sp. TaxID=2053492 RepID=UPI00262CE409|nr:hypothetical protein [Accumulibacter sp.]